MSLRQTLRSTFLVAVAAHLGFCWSGCGGETSSPAPTAGAPPAPSPIVAQAARGGEEGDAPRPARPAPDRREDPVASPTATARQQEYPPGTYLLGVDSPNFVLPMQRQADPDDQFLIARADTAGSPQPDSRQFLLPASAAAGEQGSRPVSTFVAPEGFSIYTEVEVSELGYPEAIRCDIDNSVMRFVPGGVYVQGIDNGPANAGPAHAAMVDPFYMDAYEVMIWQYEAFREAMREAREPVPAEPVNAGSSDFHPALGISWRDAMRYAEWAGKSLPSEAEWELAARGLDSHPYVWGRSRAIWPRPRVPGQIDPVGSFPTDRSVFGIYDLAGNAREWCQDFYSDNAYSEARDRDGGPLQNWMGPTRATITGHRVVRGSNTTWDAWARGSHNMSEESTDIGFRCVLRVGPAPTTEAPVANPVGGPNFSDE